jgi:hypothetical protein
LWSVETNRISGLSLDHEMKPGRLIDRQVAELRAFENLVHERSGAAKEIREILGVAHQLASFHAFTLREYRRQTDHRSRIMHRSRL